MTSTGERIAAGTVDASKGPGLRLPPPLWRGLARIPVPPPFAPGTWRSPLRGRWLTSVFGLVLLIGLPIVIVTGLLSWLAYGPRSAQAIPPTSGTCGRHRWSGRPRPRGSTA